MANLTVAPVRRSENRSAGEEPLEQQQDKVRVHAPGR